MKTLDIERILATNIPDIHPAYGGVRGKTMSSRGQGYAWPVIKEAGVDTIIDLRNDGVNQRMMTLCEEYGMEYFYYPVDNHADMVKSMVDLFPELCRRIDRGCFYIACAMGLHRTDIALCTYWVFYGADRESIRLCCVATRTKAVMIRQRFFVCSMRSTTNLLTEMDRNRCLCTSSSAGNRLSMSSQKEVQKKQEHLTNFIMTFNEVYVKAFMEAIDRVRGQVFEP